MISFCRHIKKNKKKSQTVIVIHLRSPPLSTLSAVICCVVGKVCPGCWFNTLGFCGIHGGFQGSPAVRTSAGPYKACFWRWKAGRVVNVRANGPERLLE